MNKKKFPWKIWKRLWHYTKSQSLFPTKENLVTQKCSDSPLCLLCGVALESIGHLLFECSFASKVWDHCQLSHIFHHLPRSVLHLSLSFLSIKGPSDVDLFRKCTVIGWGIWKARNLWCFSGEKPKLKIVCSTAIHLLEEFDSALLPSVEGNQLSNPSSPPSSAGFHFSPDGAFIPFKGGAIGGVLRSTSGSVINSFGRKCTASSALISEALALHECCCRALVDNLYPCSFFCYFRILVSSQIQWEISALVEDIKL